MSNVYFIYASIPETIFNTRIKYFLDPQSIHRYRMKHGFMYGLYAWTTSKKKMKSFLDTRNKNIYTVVKKELDKESEISELKRTMGNLQLDYYLYKSDAEGEELCVTSTKDEFIASTEEAEMHYWEFVISDLVDVDFRIFNKEMQYALDLLGYTEHYAGNYTEDNDLADEVMYNKSYHKTFFGFESPYKGLNEANLLLYLFEYMFIGPVDDNDKEGDE